MVGTKADYKNVRADDPEATLEQLEGAIDYHEKGIESSLQRTLRCDGDAVPWNEGLGSDVWCGCVVCGV